MNNIQKIFNNFGRIFDRIKKIDFAVRGENSDIQDINDYNKYMVLMRDNRVQHASLLVTDIVYGDGYYFTLLYELSNTNTIDVCVADVVCEPRLSCIKTMVRRFKKKIALLDAEFNKGIIRYLPRVVGKDTTRIISECVMRYGYKEIDEVTYAKDDDVYMTEPELLLRSKIAYVNSLRSYNVKTLSFRRRSLMRIFNNDDVIPGMMASRGFLSNPEEYMSNAIVEIATICSQKREDIDTCMNMLAEYNKYFDKHEFSQVGHNYMIDCINYCIDNGYCDLLYMSMDCDNLCEFRKTIAIRNCYTMELMINSIAMSHRCSSKNVISHVSCEFLERLVMVMNSLGYPVKHRFDMKDRTDAWKSAFGRVPKAPILYVLDVAIIKNDNFKKSFMYMAKNLPKEMHDVIGMANAMCIFGKMAETIIGCGWTPNEINRLPNPMSSDQQKWFIDHMKSQGNKDVVLATTLRFHTAGLRHGMSLKEANELVLLTSYDNVDEEYKPIALKAAGFGYSQKDFEAVCYTIKNTAMKEKLLSIDEEIVDDNFTLSMLAKGDVDHLFAGSYTGCCQHVGGVGEKCAIHAYSSDKGTTYVVKDTDNKIVAISWTWVGSNGEVCFDNIELHYSLKESDDDDTLNRIYDMYHRLAKKLGKKFDTNVYCGVGYLKDNGWFRKFAPAKSPELPPDYYGYTDTHNGTYLLYKKGDAT